MKKPLKILTEASGCLTSSYIIEAIKQAGHIACASDIDSFNAAKIEADEFILMPKANDPNLWEKTLNLCLKHNIDVVLPTLDESLLGWSERIEMFAKHHISVLLSPPHTIATFIDKWQSYKFFKKIHIPTPKSALYKHYGIVKPRFGRGGVGIAKGSDFLTGGGINEKDSYLTQEEITGQEYTIDCLFDPKGEPLYIIPRARIVVRDGKSTKGEVCYVKSLNEYILKIAKHISFVGAINAQAFITQAGEVYFIEINPRLGGGSALSFAASENWVEAMIEMFIYHQPHTPKPISYGLKMARSYKEVYF